MIYIAHDIIVHQLMEKVYVLVTIFDHSNPGRGYDLAILMSRMGVKKTQPDDAVRSRLRAVYANDADSLTSASQVIATNFQTVAAANDYWRS